MISKTSISDVNATPGLTGIGNLLGKSPVASFNLDGIENLINTKGFLGFHIKSAINPDRNTTAAGLNPNDNGYSRIFYAVHPIRLVPTNMGLTDTLTRVGLAIQGTAVLNLSGSYLDDPTQRVHAKSGDLIVMNPTFTEIYDQVLDYDGESTIKLHYPAREVDYLASSKQVFEFGVDFLLTPNGSIQWLRGALSPSKGDVLSIVYAASPVFTVNRVEHSTRVLPSNATGSGNSPRQARYAPQLILANLSNVRSEGPAFDPFALPVVQDWQKYLLAHEKQ